MSEEAKPKKTAAERLAEKAEKGEKVAAELRRRARRRESIAWDHWRAADLALGRLATLAAEAGSSPILPARLAIMRCELDSLIFGPDTDYPEPKEEPIDGEAQG